MSLLIIGARGMLGQALAHVLFDQQLTLWDRDEIDITDAGATREKISDLRPTTIINAAAYTDVDGAEHDREAAFAINATGVANVAAAAKAVDAKLVHYSTDYVFPGDNPNGIHEDDQPGPAVNVYGESKLAGERALRDSGATYYLLRTAWMYGPGGKNFVDTMVTLAKTKTEAKVVDDQHGSPTFTYDVAYATQEIIDKYPPGIYHTVNSGQTTWYEFAQTIFKLLEMSIKITPVSSAEFPRPAARPKYSMLINSKGPKMRPWEDALDDYLKNYHSNPSKL